MEIPGHAQGEQGRVDPRPDPDAAPSGPGSRRIRVFVSSTFRDMVEDRDALMTHAWPELRRFCREREVELVEVDLRWGIAEEQSTRRETLKLCLDEIGACRPFFIGLLGERYGWLPGDDALTADLNEEQPWLRDLRGRSVTELEILHGVLNNPESAARAFFYFRSPAYAAGRGGDFHSESPESAEKQAALKALIRDTCAARGIPLREGYADPRALAALVLEDLKAAIDAQFPLASIPDPLAREARNHEAFAESRRRTYIGRPDYIEALDRHAAGDGGPLVLLGESGSGKSALLANWLPRWHATHARDFVFQHYIGGTPDSANHGRLARRLIAEIKRWTDDSEELPDSRENVFKSFPEWLAKARNRAAREGVRCIVVLDALNQLEDVDHARQLGWLPTNSFTGAIRLVVSTLPGETFEPLKPLGWATLQVEPLSVDERRQMIDAYLQRLGKKLDEHRRNRLADASAAANPLYLKILLDELRVTGTHDRLDERLDGYLAAHDIPALLRQVLDRYRRDYERDRPGLVGETLALIWAARRGLSEAEILRLLRPEGLPQLPLATWTPFRGALEESLVDRGGILNFAHNFLRAAVEAAFVSAADAQRAYRLRLADDFGAQPVSPRSCDELPWLLRQTDSRDRLRACLLDIERFVEICDRDQAELLSDWAWLGDSRSLGRFYLEAFDAWAGSRGGYNARVLFVANRLGAFLQSVALRAESEPLLRRSLAIAEQLHGPDHPDVARCLNNLAVAMQGMNRLAEAESLSRRALTIVESSLGPEHPDVARNLANLATVLRAANRLAEAEPLSRRALAIGEQSCGMNHPDIAWFLRDLGSMLEETGRFEEAEPLMRRALAIAEKTSGPDHPDVARHLRNLASLLGQMNKLPEAESLLRRALNLSRASFGPVHPDVSLVLVDLASLLQRTGRMADAEDLLRRALAIDEECGGPKHSDVARDLSHLAWLLQCTNRQADAEPLVRRSLAIVEEVRGADHPDVARDVGNLGLLLMNTGRLAEAEPLLRRAAAIHERSYGADHPLVGTDLNHLAQLLQAMNRSTEAEQLLRRAVDIHERAYGSDDPRLGNDLHHLAQVLIAANRTTEAEPILRRVLATAESCYGPDDANVVIALHHLASLYRTTNRVEETPPLLRRALAITEHNVGPDDHAVVVALDNLASSLREANRPAEAEPLLRRALAIVQRSLAPDDQRIARYLNSLALVLFGMERPAEAEPLLRQALAIRERRSDPDDAEVAGTLTNLARVLETMGRPTEAEPLMRRALAIAERRFGPRDHGVTQYLTHLASLLFALQRPAEAEPLLRQALAIEEQRSGPDHPDVAQHLLNLGSLLEAMNRTPEAEPLLRRALAIEERRLGPDHPDLALRLNNLALLLYKTNRLTEAEVLLRRALGIVERHCGPDHVDVATSLHNLSAILQQMGRLAEAEPILRRMTEILLRDSRATGRPDPRFRSAVSNYAVMLIAMGRSPRQVAGLDEMLTAYRAASSQG